MPKTDEPRTNDERARTGDPVELTAAMVRTASVNPTLEEGGAGEAAIAHQVGDWLDGWGFDTRIMEVAPGRWNVHARLVGTTGEAGGGSAGPTLLLNGHLDTVGVAGMTIAPFEPELRSGRLTGRGACDMKAGNGMILAAAHEAALRKEGPDASAGTLEILFTADEEHASLGMAAAVQDGLEADFAIVAEPTSLAVMPAHKGFAWVMAEFNGRAAHGSRPDVGIDAIRSAGRLLAALDDLESTLQARSPHPLLGFGSVHAGTIGGGTAPSVYPDRCSLRLERRTLPDEDPSGFEAELAEHLTRLAALHADFGATLTTELVRPGSDVSPDHPGVLALLDAMEQFGLPRRIEGMTAWVDAAFLNQAGIPAICFGPGSIEQAHSAEEWVPVQEIERGAEVLTRFVRDYLG